AATTRLQRVVAKCPAPAEAGFKDSSHADMPSPSAPKNTGHRHYIRWWTRRTPRRSENRRSLLRPAEESLVQAQAYFTVVSLPSGNVVSTRSLKCTSWGTVFECNWRPIGPSLMRWGS